MPAQSPTLSPTLSAMVAGVRGSSSGIPASTFPAKSGHTGAPRLYIADEVAADVGRLGEDAAADTQEQREQRATEPEPDQDRGGGVLEDHDDERGAEQTQAHREHACDATGAEGDLQRVRQR